MTVGAVILLILNMAHSLFTSAKLPENAIVNIWFTDVATGGSGLKAATFYINSAGVRQLFRNLPDWFLQVTE